MSDLYRLKIYPDAVLRKKALPIKTIHDTLRELVDIMFEIMYTHQGIGLAAPQIGVLKRIIIADTGNDRIALFNPVITGQHGENELMEGCLSLPDVQINVHRKTYIHICGIDVLGSETESEFKGLTARVIQHEIDHLDGILITDYGEV